MPFVSAPHIELIELREFRAADYDAVIALWRSTEGIVLRDVDDREPLTAYLERQRGLSFVAVDGERVVGAVLCGTDGRRGYLQHVAVAGSHRRRGIARALVDQSVRALAARGIEKCHLMVLTGNVQAQAFWSRIGWVDRSDVRLMSHTASGAATA